MKFSTDINGLSVEAQYSDESVKQIFIPLLQHLTELQKKKGGRVLAMLAAPPAAGKSTLLAFLKELSQNAKDRDIMPVTIIGMDGFHHYQDYLLSHTTERNGETIPLVKIKGAPITFDLDLLTERIKKVASGEVCGWPEYNRLLHNPEEDAIRVSGDIVLLEGNYLLLDQPGWRDLRNLADYTIKITADPEMLRKRLVARKTATGVTREEAQRFVDYSDMENVRLCLEHSLPADLTLTAEKDGNFQIFS